MTEVNANTETLAARPAASGQRPAASGQRTTAFCCASVILLVAVCAIIGVTSLFRSTPLSSDTTKAVVSTTPTVLEITLFTPAVFNLGSIKQGERIEVAFRLQNASQTAVELGPVESSCECFEVQFSQKKIEAEGTVHGTFVLDFSKDPTFIGGLLLTAEASTVEPTPRNAFTIRVSADVK